MHEYGEVKRLYLAPEGEHLCPKHSSGVDLERLQVVFIKTLTAIRLMLRLESEGVLPLQIP